MGSEHAPEELPRLPAAAPVPKAERATSVFLAFLPSLLQLPQMWVKGELSELWRPQLELPSIFEKVQKNPNSPLGLPNLKKKLQDINLNSPPLLRRGFPGQASPSAGPWGIRKGRTVLPVHPGGRPCQLLPPDSWPQTSSHNLGRQRV